MLLDCTRHCLQAAAVAGGVADQQTGGWKAGRTPVSWPLFGFYLLGHAWLHVWHVRVHRLLGGQAWPCNICRQGPCK